MAGEIHETVVEDGSVSSPTEAAVFVPALLAGLDADDSDTVASSGRSLCVLAREHPTTIDEIVTELVERLVAEPEEGPVLRTLASLVDDHDDEIRAALLDAVDRDDARTLYRHIRDGNGWNVETETGGKPAESKRDTPAADAVREGTRPRSVRLRHARIQQVANSETFATIRSLTRFDELNVVAPKEERRYGESVRTHARTDGEEYGVAIRLPDRAGAEGFETAMASTFRDWEQIHSQGVVTAVDWGTSPRPWIGTEYVEETLADRGRLPADDALEHAHALTAGLAELHQHDVVHGGIDPGNVVYATDVLGDSTRPMLDNVGLMTVFRNCFEPSSYLDPRYAAPEYFDSQYGTLDHATDIYQLGMVLYRVCTGRPPFDGSFEEIRRQVKKEQPPAPTTVNPALPDGIDEIVAKATAKQKLTRYEAANRFYRDVDRLREPIQI